MSALSNYLLALALAEEYFGSLPGVDKGVKILELIEVSRILSDMGHIENENVIQAAVLQAVPIEFLDRTSALSNFDEEVGELVQEMQDIYLGAAGQAERAEALYTAARELTTPARQIVLAKFIYELYRTHKMKDQSEQHKKLTLGRLVLIWHVMKEIKRDDSLLVDEAYAALFMCLSELGVPDAAFRERSKEQTRIHLGYEALLQYINSLKAIGELYAAE
jgi:hypothetical protein